MPMDLQAVIIRVPPSHYIHVLDSNSNVVRVITGPSTYTRPEHERVLEGPTKMITIPPRQYAVIRDPALRSKDNPKLVVLDEHGMVKLRDGDVEIREPEAFPDPFPLYPGETLQEIKPLRVVEPNQALRLRVVRDYVAADGTAMPTGLEFLFKGPGTYRPRVEVEEREIVDAIVVRHSEALLLRARQATKDSAGNRRTAGEEWLNREPGAYLPSIDEEVVRKVKAVTLTEQRALHMRAARTFTDVYGKLRKAGEEWLVTLHDAEVHIPDVYEVTVCEAVALTTLTSRQFCVVINPTNARSGEQRLGARELRRGECSFFLRPGEVLAEGLQDVYVLGDDEALLLQAEEAFMDQGPADDISTAERKPGDRWLVRGPREYVPPVSVRVCERRRAIALDTNEGIYVRNTTTGAVRAVLGTSHMLTAREELWAKELPPDVEELLRKQGSGQVYVAPLHHGGEAPAAAGSKQGGNVVRDKSRVVQFRVPNNAAVQVYDFKAKSSRVVVGPDLICLDPDEQFTSLSLSGDTPKRPNVIKSLALMLGPDFFTDVVIVETSDHARLKVVVAYNWQFTCDRKDQATMSMCFGVRDFVGDSCKALASRVRGAVASETFDRFHKHSAKIIRASIFGIDEQGKVGDSFRFPSNNLVITNVDIQSVEPVDASTRDSLQKSVQLAIEITTDSQEARARQDAHREEEQAAGMLERQKLSNEAEAESARRRLLELKAESRAVEASGASVAEARAKSEAARIDNEGLVEAARLKAQAIAVEREANLVALIAEQRQLLEHTRALAEIDVSKAKALADVEADKFKRAVDAIGAGTLAEIARAGPEMQAKLLGGLGIKTMVVTDAKTPLNLFSQAAGMLGMEM